MTVGRRKKGERKKESKSNETVKSGTEEKINDKPEKYHFIHLFH